jgi:hypothetical protein
MNYVRIPKIKTREHPVVTFGADPEIIFDDGHELTPSWEFGITGEKGSPEKIPNIPDTWDAGYLCDGITVEFNLAPTNSLRKIASRLQSIIEATTRLPNFSAKNAQYSFAKDFIDVPRKFQDHELFTHIGCVSDLFAYSDDGRRSPVCVEDMGSLRFAGGHIHVGCEPWPSWLPKQIFIKFFDLLYWNIVGVDTTSKRMPFYGLPGLWRETSYGVEYRTPSTKWLSENNSASSLDHLEVRIRDLLYLEDSAQENIIRLHNSGMLDDAAYNIMQGNWSEGSASSIHAYAYLKSAFSGSRLLIRPTKSKLDGYTRQQLDAAAAVKIDVNDEDEEERLLPAGGPVGLAIQREHFEDSGIRDWYHIRGMNMPRTFIYAGLQLGAGEAGDEPLYAYEDHTNDLRFYSRQNWEGRLLGVRERLEVVSVIPIIREAEENQDDEDEGEDNGE